MEKKDNKKLIILVSCLLLVIGVSFSYFVAKTLFNGEGSSVSATTAVINGVTITVDGTLSFNDLDMLPGHQTVSGIKVTATGDKEAIYNLVWKGTNGLNIPLKYTVYKTTTEVSDVNAKCTKQTKIENGEQHLYETCNITNLDKLGTSISEGEIPSNPFEKTVTLKKDESIMATKAGESVYYYVVLEFPNLEEDQNIDIGNTFEGIVTVEANKLCGTHTVNTILGELEVNDCEPDFSIASSEADKGTCAYNGNEVEVMFEDETVTENTCQTVYEVNINNEIVYFDKTFEDVFTYVGTGEWDSETSTCKYNGNEVFGWNGKKITTAENCGEVYNADSEYVTMIKNVGAGTWETSGIIGGTGIYEAEDDYGTSYYYRGAVNNNWVLFAGHYWQVVRINGDGSLRLIYASNRGGGIDLTGNTAINDSAFNLNFSDNAFVGYMYGKTGGYEEKAEAETEEWLRAYNFGTEYKFDTKTGVYTLTGDIKNGEDLDNYTGYYFCPEWYGKTTCQEMYKVGDNIDRNKYKVTKYTSVNLNQSTYSEAHVNTNDSNVKKIIDEWYQDNLTSYSSYLDVNVGFCGDRELASGQGYGTHDTVYMSYNRTLYSSPSLKCPNKLRDLYTIIDSSNGNKALNYPIGLITADEVIFAGVSEGYTNENYYLFNNFLTMTPAYCVEGYASIFSGGSQLLGSEYGYIRPVININANTQVLDGDGSKNNPYKITNDEPKVPIGEKEYGSG